MRFFFYILNQIFDDEKKHVVNVTRGIDRPSADLGDQH